MKRTLCLLLFLSLTLTGCAAAAPRFDLAAGEIAAAEGLPAAAISRQSSRALTQARPRRKPLRLSFSQKKPRAQAAAVAMTLAQAAPPIPLSMG